MALQTFTSGQVLTAAQVTALQTNDFNQTVKTETASYTLVAADAGTRVVMNAATATTITVNTSLFNAGDTLSIHNVGAGVVTITAGTATVSTAGSLALAQNAGGTLYFTSTGVSIFFPSSAGSAAGISLISTTSFSGVSAASLPAATFSATYNDYRIIFKLTAGTQITNMRLRVAGADNTTSNYAEQIYFAAYTNAAAFGGATGGNQWGVAGAGELTTQTIDLLSPFATANTTLHSLYSHNANAGIRISQFRATTSFDSLTVFPNSGTISGSFVVYGYNK